MCTVGGCFGFVFVDALRQFLERLVVERVTERSGCTAPVRETAVVPVLLVRAHGRAGGVQLVHVRVERGREVDCVVHLRDLYSQVDAEVRPVHRVGYEVVPAADRQVVNQRDNLVRLLSCRILVVTDLHLDIVAQRESDRTYCTVGCIALRETRIYLERRVPQRIRNRRANRLVVRAVISPPRRAEIRVIRETDTWREHVAETVNLVAKPLAVRRIEAVEFRGQSDAHIEVEHIVEALRRVALKAVLLFVPGLVNALEIHLIAQVD